MRNLREVWMYISHLHNKILLQPLYGGFGARTYKEGGTVLSFPSDEGIIGQAILKELDAYESVSKQYWNTVLRKRKPQVDTHNLVNIKTKRQFERDYIMFRITDRLIDNSGNIRSAGVLTITSRSDPKTQVSLQKTAGSTERDIVKIGNAVDVIYNSYINFFDPFKESQSKK